MGPSPPAPDEPRPLAPARTSTTVQTLDWVYRFGFTLVAGVVLLGVVLYYTHILDERSYENAIQLQQMNAKLDEVQHQLNRMELRLVREGAGEGGG